MWMRAIAEGDDKEDKAEVAKEGDAAAASSEEPAKPAEEAETAAEQPAEVAEETAKEE